MHLGNAPPQACLPAQKRAFQVGEMGQQSYACVPVNQIGITGKPREFIASDLSSDKTEAIKLLRRRTFFFNHLFQQSQHAFTLLCMRVPQIVLLLRVVQAIK